jgi:hypothetical protein
VVAEKEKPVGVFLVAEAVVTVTMETTAVASSTPYLET